MLPAPDRRVLAQPVRARLFELLSGLSRPASTEELADTLHMHRNGVRAHLRRLSEAGLVGRASVRQQRGRPRDMWSLADGVQRDPQSAHVLLGRWLARAAGAGRADLRAIEQAGSEIGAELASDCMAQGPSGALPALFEGLGFAPTVSDAGAGAVTYRLTRCPYSEAVRERADVVCTLHRGITRGVMAQADPDAKLLAFVPRDPERAGCEVTVRGPEIGAAR